MNSILQQNPQPLVSLSANFELHLLLVGNCGENGPPARQTRPLPHGLAQQALGTFLCQKSQRLGSQGRPRGICGSRRGGEGRGVEIPGPRLVSGCLQPLLPFLPHPGNAQVSLQQAPKLQEAVTTPMRRPPGAGSRAMHPGP